MEFSSRIEPDDYVRAQFLHIRPRPLYKWLGLILGFLLIFTLAASFYVAVTRHDYSPSLLFMPACLGYLLFYFFVLLPRRTKKIYRQQKLLQQPLLIRISDEQFYSKNEYGESSLPWNTFLKWKEGKDLFLVYQTDRLFHMLPKRFFPSAEATDELREILRKHLGNPRP